LDSRDKLSKKDISSALQSASEELNKTSEKSYRSLEAEWVDFHAKIMKIAGRIEKTKGIEAAREPAPVPVSPALQRRSDLIRNRNGRKNHVEALPAE
jgi:hypothetical protein